MPQIRTAAVVTLAAASAVAQPVPVQLQQTAPGVYQLLRDGQPYRVDGAGWNNYMPTIAVAGGNSTRVWGTGSDTRGLLDEAHANGLTIAVGIWLEHGADYSSASFRAQQLARIEQEVRAYKDHPAVLLWGIGNEMEGFADGNNPDLWRHVEAIAAMIKSIDPNHPTMTTIAEIGGSRIPQIHQYCPSLDIVGINSYGGSASIPQRYRSAGGTKPYILTEYGQPGTWETGYTGWGVPYEMTSLEKANWYRDVYESLDADTDLCLGSYAFIWGSGADPTSTWYCTHLTDGSKLAVVDELTEAWGGPDPANHAPVITSFTLQGSPRLEGGQRITATLAATDRDGDPLDVTYVLQNDFWADQYSHPALTYPDKIVASSGASVTIEAPANAGPIRLYAYARDGRGGAATANIPLYAEEEPLPWNLVWEDEFDTLDTSVWQPMLGNGAEYGNPGWGNQELQHYTADPANVYADGALHIVARAEDDRYTSARLRTPGAVEVLYGRIEARIDLPKGQGIWPAFWMLPTDSPFGGWAAGGEIDIMESINQADAVHGTLHFGGTWPNNDSEGGSDRELDDYSTGYHVYSIEWEPHQMRWYVDGRQYSSIDNDEWYSNGAPNDPWAPFSHPFHMLLNVAVGGVWPGYPDASTTFPQEMKVDWVRVYERPQEPVSGTPAAVPGRIEAEAFDTGGGGVAYRDRDASNNGGAMRGGEAVDIEATSGGGFNIGWTGAGEWLEYTVDVASAGPHEVSFRVASDVAGGRLRLFAGGADLTGAIAAPDTNGWQNWTTVTRPVQLAAGEQILRVEMDANSTEFNLDRFDVAALCRGDWNASGAVDVNDLLNFLGEYRAGGPAADVTGDGLTTVQDLLGFLGAYRNGCP